MSAGAIVADTQLGGESTDWVELNAKYSELSKYNNKKILSMQIVSIPKKAILVAVN